MRAGKGKAAGAGLLTRGGPSGEKSERAGLPEVGPGSKLGWVSFGFYLSYFYLLSLFNSNSNKG